MNSSYPHTSGIIDNLIKVDGVEYKLDPKILEFHGDRFKIIKNTGSIPKSGGSPTFKPTLVIVYQDGILFTGEPEGIFDKAFTFLSNKKQWKQLLFADMQSMNVRVNDLNIHMKDNKQYILKINDSQNVKTNEIEWESFICCLYEKVKNKNIANLRNEFKDDTKPKNYYRYSPFKCIRPISSPNMGGQRKTKRSKRSKKCKRRTRRS
jgi:hypothetical protein|uniref:Uncharacterized protein n=1 Tax=viral metagenome TaxID=1070528 RepID=A0A6C0BJ80_9ZZZZ